MATSKRERSAASRIKGPNWLSLSQAAAYLGVGTKLLISRCRAQDVTFVRIGKAGRTRTGQYRFQTKWLDDYLERITVYARTPPIRMYVRARPLLTGQIFIDPRDCGNPFED